MSKPSYRSINVSRGVIHPMVASLLVSGIIDRWSESVRRKLPDLVRRCRHKRAIGKLLALRRSVGRFR